jgi:hypothetical protein
MHAIALTPAPSLHAILADLVPPAPRDAMTPWDHLSVLLGGFCFGVFAALVLKLGSGNTQRFLIGLAIAAVAVVVAEVFHWARRR